MRSTRRRLGRGVSEEAARCGIWDQEGPRTREIESPCGCWPLASRRARHLSWDGWPILICAEAIRGAVFPGNSHPKGDFHEEESEEAGLDPGKPASAPGQYARERYRVPPRLLPVSPPPTAFRARRGKTSRFAGPRNRDRALGLLNHHARGGRKHLRPRAGTLDSLAAVPAKESLAPPTAGKRPALQALVTGTELRVF